MHSTSTHCHLLLGDLQYGYQYRENPKVAHLCLPTTESVSITVCLQNQGTLYSCQGLGSEWLKIQGFSDGITRFNCIDKHTKSCFPISSCDLNPKSLLYKLCDKTPRPLAPISSSLGWISSWIQKGRSTWTSSPLPFPHEYALRWWRYQLRKQNDSARRTTMLPSTGKVCSSVGLDHTH